MMDRFKFRVFFLCCNSKLEKKWVNITEVGKFIIDKDGNLMDESAFFDPINHPENFIVEQCTGLKDKNGKLIYEGDIVNYCGEINTVVFGACGFKFKDNEGLCIEPYRTDVEIIGNIHEQQEQKGGIK